MASTLNHAATKLRARATDRMLRARNLDIEGKQVDELRRALEKEAHVRDQEFRMREVEVGQRETHVEEEVKRKVEATLELARGQLRVKEDDVAVKEQLLAEKAMGFPWLARAYADWEHLKQLKVAEAMDMKPHAAPISAERVREMAGLRREVEQRWRVAQGIIEYLLTLFPFLEGFLGDVVDEDLLVRVMARNVKRVAREEAEIGIDPTRVLLSQLSDEEWERLSPAERNQLALDRYQARSKSRWEIGREYERYIGYLHEEAGCQVFYQGILEGRDDMGRDIVARKGPQTRIAQCKCWASYKVINEKHVCQLFGTVVKYRIDHPEEKVVPVLYVTNELSARARDFASQLHVQVNERFPLAKYPVIKCNVSRTTGERIYHLPFDQQYDRTVIEPQRGECYAWTVAEAEGMGFRRAWRWRGEEEET